MGSQKDIAQSISHYLRLDVINNESIHLEFIVSAQIMLNQFCCDIFIRRIYDFEQTSKFFNYSKGNTTICPKLSRHREGSVEIEILFV